MEFVSDCMCDGPVEGWLQNVVDSMKAALAAEFKRCARAGLGGSTGPRLHAASIMPRRTSCHLTHRCRWLPCA